MEHNRKQDCLGTRAIPMESIDPSSSQSGNSQMPQILLNCSFLNLDRR